MNKDSTNQIAIIAAMEREIAPLVKGRGWRPTDLVSGPYRCFESESAVVVCAGIGPKAAAAAAEKVIAARRPRLVVSAGLAGALIPGLRVGQIFVPVSIVSSCSSFRLNLSHGKGDGVLVSASGIAGLEAKRMLCRQHSAQAVDMEAAPIADVAQGNGIPFVAIKAISDEYDFPMPDLEPFVTPEGKFQTARFTLYTALHPASWQTVARLSSNSSRAIKELCRVLGNMLEHGTLEHPELASELAAQRKETGV